MIGAAIDADISNPANPYYVFREQYYLGYEPANVVKGKPKDCRPRPNISGPSQAYEIDGNDPFCIDTIDGMTRRVERIRHKSRCSVYHAILEMLQAEPAEDTAGPAVGCETFEPPCEAPPAQPAHNLPERGEGTLFLTWWLLMSDESPIRKELDGRCQGLQYRTDRT